jgi:hypothetical protein
MTESEHHARTAGEEVEAEFEEAETDVTEDGDRQGDGAGEGADPLTPSFEAQKNQKNQDDD